MRETNTGEIKKNVPLTQRNSFYYVKGASCISSIYQNMAEQCHSLDDNLNAMEKFKPKTNFGFLKRFRESSNLSKTISKQSIDKDIQTKKLELLQQLHDLLNNNVIKKEVDDTKIYHPSSKVEYDDEDLVKIYLPKKRI